MDDIASILGKASSPSDIEKLLLEKSKKYHDRYLTFKEYQELTAAGKLKEPIVPVIGGLPCTGKTTLTRELGMRLGLGTLISGDTVRESLRELISEKDHPEFFTSVYDSWKFFGNEPTEEAVISGYRKQAEIINRVLQKIIWRAAIKDGESMIVEYLHFLPELIDKEVLEHQSVIPIVLKISDEEIHKERIKSRTNFHLKGGWQRLIDNLKQYRIMQEYQVEQARKFSIPVIENNDIDETVDKALDIIFERIRKLNASVR